MGTQKQTTTQETGPMSGMENSILQMLMQIAQGAKGQMGDMSELAKGGVGGPTEADLKLIQDTIGRTGEMGRREMERSFGPMMAQIGERMTGQNVKGSSIELLQNALGGREMQGRLADLLGQSQQQGSEALMNLPFRRADVKMGANQMLFNMLTGASSPVLQNLLGRSLANTKTTTETGRNPMEMLSMAMKLGGAIPTGGASLAMPDIGGSQFNENMAPLGMYGRGGR